MCDPEQDDPPARPVDDYARELPAPGVYCPPDPPEGEPPTSCDWGGCERWARAWRVDRTLGVWLPVCLEHALADGVRVIDWPAWW